MTHSPSQNRIPESADQSLRRDRSTDSGFLFCLGLYKQNTNSIHNTVSLINKHGARLIFSWDNYTVGTASQ